MTHPQLDVLRKSDEAFANGDIDGYFALFHDDVVVHLPGRYALAGDYTGKDALRALYPRFAERYSPTGGETVAMFADDEYGIWMERYSATREGSTFEEQIVSVMRIRDGKVAEMWVIPFDQAARDEWMA